jgi:hypothetical protein
MAKLLGPQPCLHCEEEFVPANPHRYFCQACPESVRHPEKVEARRLYRNALNCGRLSKPYKCEIPRCASFAQHGHHKDYSKPLKVQWLCQKHHIDAHEDSRRASRPERVRKLTALLSKRREALVLALIDNYAI